MEFGFMMGISPREPVARFASLAVLAEDSGFSMAWLANSQLIFKDPYLAMAIASQATKRIAFGPGVANPITRHLSALACTMTTLDEVSGGRAILGIGSGDSSVFPLGKRGATIAELREQIRSLRDLCSGVATVVEEQSIRMLTGKRPIPIILAASQPRMLQLAGEVADGVILMGAADAVLTQWQLDHVARGAAAAGRSLADLFVDLWCGISISDDEEQARHDVRAFATSQARWFSKWKEVPGPIGNHREEFAAAFAAYRFSEHLSTHAGHAQLISDELVDLIAVSGSAERCRERISSLLDLHIDRLTFTLLPGGRERRIRQFGEELIAKLPASQRAAP